MKCNPNDIWINLPVKDVAKATKFYEDIGFNINYEHNRPGESTCMVLTEKRLVVMLFREDIFTTFIPHSVRYNNGDCNVVLSLGCNNHEEVNMLAEQVKNAGGNVFAPAGEKDGWMYACGFEDLDGHLWNPIFMDFEKMPK